MPLIRLMLSDEDFFHPFVNGISHLDLLTRIYHFTSGRPGNSQPASILVLTAQVVAQTLPVVDLTQPIFGA